MEIQRKIDLKIKDHSIESIGKKQVVFYHIFLETGDKKWEIRKRYNEILNLHKFLKKVIGHLPKFPSKTLFKVKARDKINNRLMKLESYLKLLLERQDIHAYPSIIYFFEVRS